jgi:hypothetical protein
MKFIIAGIIALVVMIALLTFLPSNITSPITRPFANMFSSKPKASPSPSVQAVALGTPVPTISTQIRTNAPVASGIALTSPRSSTDPYTGSTVAVSGSPRASAQVAAASLPGTGEEKKDPLILTLQIFLSSFVIILGWKLSKYVQ